jgi:DNA primase
LFDRLTQVFGQVRIANNGMPFTGVPMINWNNENKKKLYVQITSYGETYRVNCPFCGDTRARLNVNHRWGIFDPRTGDDNLHLVKCFNEDCLNTRQRQLQLHVLVFGLDSRYWTQDLPDIPKRLTQPKPAACPVQMPDGVPLDTVDPAEPVLEYVASRGLDPVKLAQKYGVIYCPQDRSCRPQIFQPRIVIPIYALSGEPSTKVLVGWQARLVATDLTKSDVKYLTSAGTKKSHLFYGLPLAIDTKGAVVIVEGVVDAWKVGDNALALIGKTISTEQVGLLLRHFRGRPIVVLLDNDAEGDAEIVCKRIQLARSIAGDVAAVAVGHCPPGRKDPGECTSDEVQLAISKALGGRHARKH